MKFRVVRCGSLPTLLGSAAMVFFSSLCRGQGCMMLAQEKKTDVTCYGAANGTASVTLTGGKPPFTYSGGLSFRTSNQVAVFHNLSPGNYNFTVTDATGCQVNHTLDITEPPALRVSGLVVNAGNHLSDASISVTESGGTPPYTFLWNTGSQSPRLSGLGAGTYAFTVTDANKCTVMLIEVLPSVANADSSATPPGMQSASRSMPAVRLAQETVFTPYLYPNPSGGLVHIRINSEERGNAAVNLVDMSGRIIKTMMVELEKGINTKDMQLPVRSGIYMLQVRTDRESRTLPVRIY